MSKLRERIREIVTHGLQDVAMYDREITELERKLEAARNKRSDKLDMVDEARAWLVDNPENAQ